MNDNKGEKFRNFQLTIAPFRPVEPQLRHSNFYVIAIWLVDYTADKREINTIIQKIQICKKKYAGRENLSSFNSLVVQNDAGSEQFHDMTGKFRNQCYYSLLFLTFRH